VQGLPDAEAPENVLSLIDSLQTQALKSAEQMGERESQLATQKGKHLSHHSYNLAVL